jgi:KDO2-lipid IV(A) lauroyltransferase
MRQASPAQQNGGRALRHHFDSPFFRRMALWGTRNIPEPLQRLSMPLWAGIFYALLPAARRTTERNLARAASGIGPRALRKLSFRLWVNYAQAVTNMYRLHLGLPVPIELRAVGDEILFDLKKQGRGAVLVTGHIGNWQIAPFLMAPKSFAPMTMAMAEESNPQLTAFEQRFRERLRIVYTTRSLFSGLELASILRRGEWVGMQIDRPTAGGNVWLPFLGAPARFPLGPAMLARATQCPLVPSFITSDGGGQRYVYHVEPPIEVARTNDRDADLRQATARLVATYERFVRRYPDQWFSFHDFWAPA